MDDVAKIFWTGRSQAVRLPKAYRFDGDQVRISREGGRVILEAVEAPPLAWLYALEPLDDDAAAAALDRPDPNHPDNRLDDDIRFD